MIKKYLIQLLQHSLIAILISLSLNSCSVLSPTRMLRTPSGYDFAVFSDTLLQKQYIITPNDELLFMIYSLDGERIIEYTFANQTSLGLGLTYNVEMDGTVKLPIVRSVLLAGMTERQAEDYLEGLFSEFLNKPFVRISVVNKRVTVFPGGEGGNAQVVSLKNNQTTLLEALATVGGINDGRADKIKLIRGDLKKPHVYSIDLSTLKGMTEANLILQANDIIVVEPRTRVAQKVLREITPFISIFTTLLVIYGLFK